MFNKLIIIMESKLNEMVQKYFDEPQRQKIIVFLGTIAYIIMLFFPLAVLKDESVTGWDIVTEMLIEKASLSAWFLYIGFLAPIIGLLYSERNKKSTPLTGILMLTLPVSILMFGFFFAKPLSGFYLYTIISILMIAIGSDSFKENFIDFLKNHE